MLEDKRKWRIRNSVILHMRLGSVIQSNEIGVCAKQASCIVIHALFPCRRPRTLFLECLLVMPAEKFSEKRASIQDSHRWRRILLANPRCFRYGLFKFNSIKQARKLIKLFLYLFPLLFLFSLSMKLTWDHLIGTFWGNSHISMKNFNGKGGLKIEEFATLP